jgi:DNA polymerase-3 subunit alpha
VGEAAMESLAAERERGGAYKSPVDFARRMDGRQINRRQLENLVKAGAFDSIEPNRGRLFKNIETLTRLAAAEAEQRESNQINMFGGPSEIPIKLENAPDWSSQDRLSHEFDAIGFYLSAHPLDAFAKSLKRLGVLKSTELVRHLKSGGKGRVKLAGSILSKQERTSAKGSRFAFLQLSDAAGMYEITCFSEVLSASRDLLDAGGPLLVEVDARLEDDQLRLTCQHISSLDQEAAKASAGVKIHIRDTHPIAPLQSLISSTPRGRNRIAIVSLLGSREVEVGLKDGVQLSPKFLSTLRSLPGVAEVEEI